MVTFSQDNIYFNETVQDFAKIGKIYPKSFGATPIYRFSYKGKILKQNDYDFFSKYLKPQWKQIRFSKRSNKIEKEQLHEPLLCNDDQFLGVGNLYQGTGALQLCPQTDNHYMQNSPTLSDEYDFFEFHLIPNYDGTDENKKEIDDFIDTIVIQKLMLDQRPDFLIYGRRPTNGILEELGFHSLKHDHVKMGVSSLQFNTIQDVINLIQFGQQSNYEYVQLHKFKEHMSQQWNNDTAVYIERFQLSNTQIQYSRTVYGLWDVFGDVGGTISVIQGILAYWFVAYSLTGYKYETIKHLFLAQVKKNGVKSTIPIKITTLEKILNIFFYQFFCNKSRPKKVMKIGKKLIKKQLDLLTLVQTVRQLKTFIKQQMPKWQRLKDVLVKDSEMRVIKLYSSSCEEEHKDEEFSQREMISNNDQNTNQIMNSMKNQINRQMIKSNAKKKLSVRLGKLNPNKSIVGIQVIHQLPPEQQYTAEGSQLEIQQLRIQNLHEPISPIVVRPTQISNQQTEQLASQSINQFIEKQVQGENQHHNNYNCSLPPINKRAAPTENFTFTSAKTE